MSDIHSYLSHIFEASRAKRRSASNPDDLAVVTYGEPPWPEVGDDLIMRMTTAEHSDVEASKKEIVGRLKSVEYPYPERTKSRGTFYDRLQSLPNSDFLISTPLIWKIRMVWKFQRYSDLRNELKRKKLSQYGYPLEFHRKMLLRLFQHAEQISEIADEYDVPKLVWLRDYSSAIQSQLLKEGAAYYPEFRRWFRPAHKLTVRSHSVSMQVDLYRDIYKALSSQRRGKWRKLSFQLTALMCSSSDSIGKGILKPNPEMVRKYLRDVNKRNRKNKSDKTSS